MHQISSDGHVSDPASHLVTYEEADSVPHGALGLNVEKVGTGIVGK